MEDALVKAKRQLAEAALSWNQRLRQVRPLSGPKGSTTSSSTTLVNSSTEFEENPPASPLPSQIINEAIIEESPAPISPPIVQPPQLPNDLPFNDNSGNYLFCNILYEIILIIFHLFI